jgi:HK97 family phage prohead protease
MGYLTFGETRSFDRSQAEKTRTVPFIFSTGDTDRHGTRLNMDNWKLDAFNRNGVALFMHAQNSDDPDHVIGSARAWVENGRLLGTITFEPPEVNPLAEKVFQKVLLGTLKAVSVGFLPIGRGEFKDDVYYYSGQELLEISVVAVPSNAYAVARKMSQRRIEQMRRRVRYLKLK